MTNMTLAVPEDLHIIMRKHKEIRWSEVAREALWNQAKKLDFENAATLRDEIKNLENDLLDLV